MAHSETGFLAKSHGYHFRNSFVFSFDFEIPLVGKMDLGDIVYGLCGGMCFSALDHYHAGLPIPPQTRRPKFSTDLFNALVNRQLDSMEIPKGILRVLEWMIRDDKDVWRMTAWREFPKLRRNLD